MLVWYYTQGLFYLAHYDNEIMVIGTEGKTLGEIDGEFQQKEKQ